MKELLSQYIEKYTRQIETKNVAKGYRGLMEYLLSLRTHFLTQYATEFKVGTFYQGYMDISYCPIRPISLKES